MKKVLLGIGLSLALLTQTAYAIHLGGAYKFFRELTDPYIEDNTPVAPINPVDLAVCEIVEENNKSNTLAIQRSENGKLFATIETDKYQLFFRAKGQFNEGASTFDIRNTELAGYLNIDGETGAFGFSFKDQSDEPYIFALANCRY